MAIVKWAKGIEFVSGLLSKRPKAGDMHSDHTSALLATHRVAETTNPNCTRIYMVGKYNRSTQPSANEMAARNRFAAVRAMVKARKTNLTKKAVPLHRNSKERTQIMRKLLIMTVITTCTILASCNVTRTVTNESQYWQKGDTSVVIQTRTVETYDASKK